MTIKMYAAGTDAKRWFSIAGSLAGAILGGSFALRMGFERVLIIPSIIIGGLFGYLMMELVEWQHKK